MNIDKKISIPDNEQNIQIGKNKRKINLAILISLLALATSIVQLIITSPFFLDVYNSPKIIVTEAENWIFQDNPIISTNYHIENYSNKTASNLILMIDTYESTVIDFIPENSFSLIDSVDGHYNFSKRLIYKKEKLIPYEKVNVNFANHIDSVAIKVGGDSLIPFVAYNCQHLVPKIAELKTDLGYSRIDRAENYILKLVKFEKVGSYELKGEPLIK